MWSLPAELEAKYQVIGTLGAGGMGSVLKARNRLLSDQVVAIKRPLVGAAADSRDELARRILAEGKGLAQLGGNANVARVVDLCEIAGELFLIMEFIEGYSLEKWVNPKQPRALETEQVAALGVQAADAMMAAHALGILHRDIKPSNLMLTPRGRLVLVDFGLAEFSNRYGVGAAPDPEDGIAGSLYYGAPEIWSGEAADARSDIYSLGVTLYEMATGVNPFRYKGAKNFEEALAWIMGFNPPVAIEVNRRLAPAISEVLASMMAKDRNDRPATVSDVLARWEAALLASGLTLDELRARPDGTGPQCLHLASLLAGEQQADADAKARLAPRRGLMGGGGVWPWVTATSVSAVLAGGGIWMVWRTAQNQIAETRQLLEFSDSQIREGQSALSRAEARAQNLGLRLGEVEGRLQAATDEAVRQRETLAERENSLARSQAVLSDTRARLVTAETRLAAADERIAELNDQITKAAARTPTLPVRFPLDETAARAAQVRWAESLGLPVRFVNSLDMPLALIPPGSYMRGSPETENGRFDDESHHPVAITRPFYMGVFTVTNAEFRRFLPQHNSQSITGIEEGQPREFTLNDDRQPAVSVVHNEAVKFCQWLSEQPEEKAAGRRYRLPTEAEWEYACRAGSQSRFSWGAGIDPTKMNFADKNCADSSANRDMALDDGYAATAPVGSYAPNAWGLSDMHGNVYQFCADRYGPYPTNIGGGELADPFRAGNKGEPFISRGGSWRSPPLTARCAARNRAEPAFLGEFVGFRVVCEITIDTTANAKPGQPKLSETTAPRKP